MATSAFQQGAAPRRGVFPVFALLSVLVLTLLALSVLRSEQDPTRFAPTLEELDDIDFDNHAEVKDFLASKIRAAGGDQYL